MKLKSILKTLFIISIICGINSCKEKKNEKIKEVKVVNENKKLGLKNAVVLNLKNLEKNKKLDFIEKYRKLLINPKDASNSEKKIVRDSWMNFHEKLNNFIKKEKFEWGISDSEIPVFQRVYFGKNGKIEHYEFKVHNEFITKEKENEFENLIRKFSSNITYELKRDYKYTQCGTSHY